MLEEKTNLRSKDIKGTETYGKRPATMNQTHQVIGTCAAHISWNLRSRDSEVEFIVDGYIVKGGYCRGFLFFNLSCWGVSNFLVLLSYSLKIYVTKLT